jgi:hypothetical protein
MSRWISFLKTTALTVVAVSTMSLAAGSNDAFAVDFSAADTAFAQRTDAASRASALKLYTDLLATTSGSEKLYAVEQIARLNYYVASLVPESDTDGRKKEFGTCLDTAELVNPTAFGSDTPQYRYWKALCLASWAKANGVLKSLEKAGEIQGHLQKGIGLDPNYEGGGFYRVSSAVLLNLPPLFGGDVQKAYDYSQKAIASPAYSGSLNPDTDTGNYFYLAYLYSAQIAEKREGKPQAKAIVEAALARINAGDLPVGREPETALQKVDLETYLATLN